MSDCIAEMCRENTRLRADLAAVTEERDGMKEALNAGIRFVGASDDAMEELHIENEKLREALKPFLIERRPEHNVYGYKMVFVKPDDFRRARAAIEGVTEPANTQTGER